MEKIMLTFGKVMKGTIVGPIKASTTYAKTKLTLKKYEKQTGVIPLNKLKKKVYKSNESFVDLNQEIANPLVKLLQATSANTTDVYLDKDGNPMVSCSYQVNQNLLNKNTTLVCNCVGQIAKMNTEYYYLALAMKYNVHTDQSESLLTSLLTKVR